LRITHTDEDHNISALKSDKFELSADVLCNNWGTGKTIAEDTIKSTTHLKVQTINHPNVERRWPAGADNSNTGDLTMLSITIQCIVIFVSSRGNKCCEIHITNFGWSRSYPMQNESKVHETLDLFLSRYGVPESLISDGAKAYTVGEYLKKAKQAGIFCKVTDPYSPWQNRAESEIREVKRLASKWTVKSQSPRRLWDHAIELASIVCSHLVLDLYKLKGQFLKPSCLVKLLISCSSATLLGMIGFIIMSRMHHFLPQR
jgi:hypothetical protein